MGYYMEQRGSEFFIPQESVTQARRLLKKLFMEGKRPINARNGYLFSWINTNEVLDAESFPEAMEACRWKVTPNNKGDIIGICFVGEKFGDDEEVLNSIAPCVKDGSYVQMYGEDNDMWRWVFRNGKVIEVRPQITWDY